MPANHHELFRLDAGGPGHPTGCVVAITAGLPVLGVSFALFSNNKFTVGVVSQQPLPNIASGSNATVRVNSTYIFSKVKNVAASDHLHVLDLAPVENTPIQTAYNALNQIVYNTTLIAVVADDAQLPSIKIAAKPGIADALKACQQYLISR